MFYVYSHSDPSTGLIRYIGKGHGRRAYSLSHRHGHHKKWLNYLARNQLKPVISIIESDLTEHLSLEREIYWISYYKSNGHPLTNGTNGGDGVSGYRHTAESKEKMGVANRGKTQSPERITKSAIANKGKKRSIQARLNISNGKKNIKLSDLHKKRLSDSRTGQKCSPEAVAKRIASNTGKTRTAEQKAKWSKAIICIETNTVYPSAREAAIQLKISEQKLYYHLKRSGKLNGFTFLYFIGDNLC